MFFNQMPTTKNNSNIKMNVRQIINRGKDFRFKEELNSETMNYLSF